MFAIQKPSEDGKYKAAGLEGFMTLKPKGMQWLKWEPGLDSTCHHVTFLNIYGLRDKTGNYGTYECAEFRVMCYGSGPNDRSVASCQPFEAMMGPTSSWCTPIRRLFDRIMRDAGWDGSGATAERFASEIGRHTIALARKDVRVGDKTCGELTAEIVDTQQDNDVPF